LHGRIARVEEDVPCPAGSKITGRWRKLPGTRTLPDGSSTGGPESANEPQHAGVNWSEVTS
jgi:hypothetical protein